MSYILPAEATGRYSSFLRHDGDNAFHFPDQDALRRRTNNTSFLNYISPTKQVDQQLKITGLKQPLSQMGSHNQTATKMTSPPGSKLPKIV
jgi:hypothetical protein